MKRNRMAAVMSVCLCVAGLICPRICYGDLDGTDKNVAEYAGIVWEEEETQGTNVTIEAPSAVLMEASTGTVIMEKASREQLRPASITKIMTLILIFDALEDGSIKLEDQVTTSEHASSMGGSQVFLEPNEQQTVDTMIKCISVASANDACVAYRHSRQRRIPVLCAFLVN